VVMAVIREEWVVWMAVMFEKLAVVGFLGESENPGLRVPSSKSSWVRGQWWVRNQFNVLSYNETVLCRRFRDAMQARLRYLANGKLDVVLQ
jgi:hypothetical protein